MEVMLSRLAVYARNKHLTVNTFKSEVVHFNSAGENVSVFDVGGATLHHKDSFRYLGMVFYRTLNMAPDSTDLKTPNVMKSTSANLGVTTSEPAERRKGTAQRPFQHSPRSLRYSPHHPSGCGRHHLPHSHSEALLGTGSRFSKS